MSNITKYSYLNLRGFDLPLIRPISPSLVSLDSVDHWIGLIRSIDFFLSEVGLPSRLLRLSK